MKEMPGVYKTIYCMKFYVLEIENFLKNKDMETMYYN